MNSLPEQYSKELEREPIFKLCHYYLMLRNFEQLIPSDLWQLTAHESYNLEGFQKTTLKNHTPARYIIGQGSLEQSDFNGQSIEGKIFRANKKIY